MYINLENVSTLKSLLLCNLCENQYFITKFFFYMIVNFLDIIHQTFP